MEQNKEGLTLAIVKKRKKRRKRIKVILIIAGIIVALCICAVAAFFILRKVGENSLKGNVQNQAKENYITYQGKKYQYKKDMVNILCLGVDIRQENLDEWTQEDAQAQEEASQENESESKQEAIERQKLMGNKTQRRAGQADAIFLVALDTKEHTMDVIAVPRDTMVPVKKYSVSGEYEGTQEMQITLQHAYGDGKEQSCELMEEAVSNLFYQLPINGYCSINMLALPIVNDAVGGVTVHIDEDLTLLNPEFTTGSDVLLQGEAAMDFVGGRDITVAQSSLARIGRQKEYLMSFVPTAKKAIKKDITLPVQLYQTLSQYMVTDISADEVTYLASEGIQCDFSQDNLHIVDVDVQMGEQYEEYYAKDDELYQMIIDIFYEEVK